MVAEMQKKKNITQVLIQFPTFFLFPHLVPAKLLDCGCLSLIPLDFLRKKCKGQKKKRRLKTVTKTIQ